ncbi:uncharacterized protein LOC126108595 isoform X2 [Schistocerca cancellata]|uniref:uncharacterized protein LOC126108595 isoform X2 n=1 Tax=Schistocerca cancellata TaxID=274614 RepID=UPI002119538F|nr:uncharacterized protein LOC126108595 isoform X2 [Schistocerca cancellata]
MDRKKTTWIKEETNEIPSSPGSIVQVCPSSVKIKEESQETGNQEYLEDPVVASGFTDSIKEDPVLSFGAEETENFLVVSRWRSCFPSIGSWVRFPAGSRIFTCPEMTGCYVILIIIIHLHYYRRKAMVNHLH